MYHYQYVSKREAAPYKELLISIIHQVQNSVRDKFTFQFAFIGSSKRDMITYDPLTNKGFDFDVDIEVNDDDENYSPKDIRIILRNAFNKIAPIYGYSFCEDSTRVFTIKQVTYPSSIPGLTTWKILKPELTKNYCQPLASGTIIRENSTGIFNEGSIVQQPRIIYSCDFAVIYNGKRQQYIRYNKTTGAYTWEYKKHSNKELEKRANTLKKNGYWNEVRDIYLYKKNTNDIPQKRSMSLYAETINECYRRHFYR